MLHRSRVRSVRVSNLGALPEASPTNRKTHILTLAPYVCPTAYTGRLLLFDAIAVEHEVMPAYAPRMAVTLWAFDFDACLRA